MFRVNTPSGGKTLLYIRYRDMRSRANGRGTKTPWIYPKQEWPWKSFAEFRAWALASGFNKVNCSPDRDDPRKPYVPGNITWRTLAANLSRARGKAYYASYVEPPPVYDDAVPF